MRQNEDSILTDPLKTQVDVPFFVMYRLTLFRKLSDPYCIAKEQGSL